MTKMILADGRWRGAFGIGRFSEEVLPRLQQTEILRQGPPPLSIWNFFWLPFQLFKKRASVDVYFNPGFNPVLYSSIPFVLTLHDLTHLYFSNRKKFLKKLYYNLLLKSAVRRAQHIITVSDFSKTKIMEWAKIPAEKITVVGNGVSQVFKSQGSTHQPHFPFLLHVGNAKTHKNMERMIEAFALADIDSNIKLVSTAKLTPELQNLIKLHRLENRIVVTGLLSDERLAEYYRGSLAFIFPSLHEGFGIPVLEAMACGTPVLTAKSSSLPEVAGDAALYIDPYQVESIAIGIKRIVEDVALREKLIREGFERVKIFSWEKTAAKVQYVLDSVRGVLS